jgi:hypothetical protein
MNEYDDPTQGNYHKRFSYQKINPVNWLATNLGIKADHITFDPDVKRQYRIVRNLAHDGHDLLSVRFNRQRARGRHVRQTAHLPRADSMTDLLCPKCDGTTVEHHVKELTAQRDKLLAILAAFGKHGRGCASGWRAATGASQIGECDCGFIAAIANAVKAERK